MSDLGTTTKLLITILFVVANGFFVAAEFALVKVRGSRIDALAEAGNRHARIAKHMLEHLDGYLSGCQLGITVCSLVLGWLAEPAVAGLLISWAESLGYAVDPHGAVHLVAVMIALVIITILHMTVGEQAPKVWAIQRAEQATLLTAYPLYFFAFLFRPVIWVINGMSNAMLRLVGLQTEDGHGETLDAREIRAIVAASAQAGLISSRQRILSENVLGLMALEVRHIMLARVDVVFLSTENTPEKNLAILRDESHSRFPLCDPDLDRVAGLVHAKDLLTQILSDETSSLEQVKNIRALAHKIPTVPETQPLARFIAECQQTQTHCALVVDEHGTTVGLAFLEDAIEEIVGPLHDEFDERAAPPAPSQPGVLSIEGDMPLPEAADKLGLDPDEQADTIAGLVIAKLGRLPKQGETIPFGEYEVHIAQADERRIRRLEFRTISEAEKGSEKN